MTLGYLVYLVLMLTFDGKYEYLTSRSNSTIACFVKLYLHQMSWAVLSYQTY